MSILRNECKWRNELINPKNNGDIVEKQSHAAEVFFVNLGPTTAYINEIPLLSNSAISYGGDTESIDTTSYRIQSDIPVGKLGVWMCARLYTGAKIEIQK